MATHNHAPIFQMPNELIAEIVDLLVVMGDVSDSCDDYYTGLSICGKDARGGEIGVVNLIKTCKFFYLTATSALYKHVIQNNTYSLLYWASEHGLLNVVKLAIACSADPNQLVTSPDGFHAQGSSGRKRLPGGLYRPASWRLNHQRLHVLEQRLGLIQARAGLQAKQWYCYDSNTKQLACLGQIRAHLHGQVYVGSWRRLLFPFTVHGQPAILGFEHNDMGRTPIVPYGYSHFPPSTQHKFVHAFNSWSTPLHVAAANGHQDIIHELLQAGANVNATSSGHCAHATWTDMAVTPLHHALCNSQYETAKLLVKNGARYMQVLGSQLLTDTLLPEARLARRGNLFTLLREILQDPSDAQPPKGFIGFLASAGV